jgi:RsiW-degrading membrane proteinase PrsW (M82 family)
MSDISTFKMVYLDGIFVFLVLLIAMIVLPLIYQSPMTSEQNIVCVVVSHAFFSVIGFLVGGAFANTRDGSH